MSVAWIAPAALAGIGLIVLPIAVHLLVRQPVRRMPFPSLRFLQETRLAALRRRTIQDAWLLVCRAAIVVLAAVALAGPVFMTEARRAGMAARISRAIVTIGPVDESVIGGVQAGSFATASFTREHVNDALADALRWLNEQPASSREIVIAGALRRGIVSEAEIGSVPADVGLRFHAIDFATAPNATITALTRRDGRLLKVERDVTFSTDATRVVERSATELREDLVTISAKEDDRALANAALRAALDGGVPWTDFTTPAVVVWEGGARPADSNVRVIDMAVPRSASSAADNVHAALTASTTSVLAEPVAITPEQLIAWTRPAGAVSPTAPLSDEGDRRWIWATVLVLLAIEARLRSVAQPAATRPDEEARVA